VARPIIDSYHTVWFELHEDLMAINGLTRAAEARAGRAQ
jgi:pyruvate,orthophosphate dikinase